MRQCNLIKGDMKFQYKYGFYFLYIILVILYVFALSLLKGVVRESTGLVMIFSDPATMGLFFMGAMILLEKSEHITNSFAISPVSINEYIISKVVSIGLISVLAGLILAVYSVKNNYLVTILVLFLSSAFFSLCGLIVGANIRSINQYIIATVPFELFSFIPMILFLVMPHNPVLLIHPCYAMITLLAGQYEYVPAAFVSIICWIFGAYLLAKHSVTVMFYKLGGVKL
ncbi:MAG: ABC transporter permease [bacterium]|nr:ABC transporter permease [bacterium]